MSNPDPSIPKQRDLIREVSAYARSDSAYGLTLCVVDVALYAGAMVGVLFPPPLWARIGCSTFAGRALARTFSLARNAAHENAVDRVCAATALAPGAGPAIAQNAKRGPLQGPRSGRALRRLRQAEKLEPHPQVVVAFGFLMTNCAPSSPSW